MRIRMLSEPLDNDSDYNRKPIPYPSAHQDILIVPKVQRHREVPSAEKAKLTTHLVVRVFHSPRGCVCISILTRAHQPM